MLRFSLAGSVGAFEYFIFKGLHRKPASPHQSLILRDSFSRLPARSLLLLRRGVHRTPATRGGSQILSSL